jgi:rhodanese-related sulfurtransferase
MKKVLLDVRSEGEFEINGLENSINIPHTELTRRINELSKNDENLVYCRSGVRAEKARYVLSLMGFIAKNIGTVQDAREIARSG